MDTTIDNAPCYYFIFTDDGRIISVNASMCRDLGFDKEELSGKNIELIFTLPTRIFYQTHFFPLIKLQGYVNEIFISMLTKQKSELPVLINASRKLENGTALNVCIGIIVNNRKKFEDELISAKRKMEDAVKENTDLSRAREQLQKHTEQLDLSLYQLKNQNTELKQFNKIVTHDLQEPIRKLSIFADKLKGELMEVTGKAAGTVRKLLTVADQMYYTISGLQQYVWLTENPLTLSKVDLGKLISQVQRELNDVYGFINWQVQLTGMPLIEADHEQLHRMFYYTLDNAAKFRKPGQNAQIQIIATVMQQNRFLSFRERYHYTDYIMIEISDYGTGFDPAHKEDVFELFRKLHHGEGKGLGLALSKKIVDNHKGLIEVDSNPAEGTTLRIHLPVDHGPQI